MKRPLSFLPAVAAGLLAGWLVSKFITHEAADSVAARPGTPAAQTESPPKTGGRAAWDRMMEARSLHPIPTDDGHFVDGAFTIGTMKAGGSLFTLSPARRDLEIELSRTGLSEQGINDTTLGFPLRGGDPGFAETSARLAKTNPGRALAQVDRMSGSTDRLNQETLDRARRLIFREWLQKDPQAALKEVNSSGAVKSRTQRGARLEVFMDEWARIDPAAAAAALPGLPRDGPDFEQKSLTETILRRWHEQDPSAARAWAAATSDPALRTSLLTVADELTATSPAAKTAVLLAAPQRESHKLASTFGEWLSAEPVTAMEKLQAIPATDKFWENDAANVAQWWAISGRGTTTPEQFLDCIRTVPAGPRREALLRGFADFGASNDIPFAVRMVGEMTEGREREQAVGGLTELWMRQDPVKTSEWLSTLPAGTASRNNGVARFAENLAPDDPERAAQWASTLPDNFWQKENVVKTVLEKWRVKDATAANAWQATLKAGTPER